LTSAAESSPASVVALFKNVTVGRDIHLGDRYYSSGPTSGLYINVPSMPVHFVGRESLVESLAHRLTSGGTLALSAEGLPGVGKTTLAVALASRREVLAHFTDGVLWAGLGRQPDIMGALAAWGDALGVDVTQHVEPVRRAQAVKDAIGQRRLLLVIDDAWHEDAAMILKCGGPNCCHLLTTRDDGIAQGFAGESGKSKVPVLDEEAAVELLRQLAPKACNANPEAARKLARTVDGLPLALELLGSYLAPPARSQFPGLSNSAFAELSDPNRRLELATTRLGDLQGEEVTLHETIRLSLEALAPETVSAFHALGAFAPKPETFDLTAALAVTESNERTIALLVENNLVEYHDKKLALHQTIREVALQSMSIEAQHRHTRHYLARASTAGGAWRDIEAVYGQIKWAFEFATEDELVFRFMRALVQYQRLRGLWADLLNWHERGLEIAVGQKDHMTVATLLNNIGLMYENLGQREKALEYHERALPIRQEVEDRSGEATTLNNLGCAYDSLGQWRKALQYYERALSIMQEVGNRSGEATTLNNIGLVYDNLGQREKALQYYQRALPIRQEVEDHSGEAATLNNLGAVYYNLGQREKALQYYERALRTNQEVGDRAGEATTLNNLGFVYKDLGQHEQALQYYQRALAIRQEVEDRSGEATTLNNLGGVYDNLDQREEALQYYERSLAMMQEVGDRAGEATTLNNLGYVYNSLGENKKALQYYERALPMMQEIGNRAGEATTLSNLGSLHDSLGQREKALWYYERALPAQQEVGDRAGEAATLSNLGFVYDSLGQQEQALQSFECALLVQQEVGDRSGEASTRFNIATIFFRQRDLEKAVVELRRVVELDELVQHPNLERDRTVLAKIEEDWKKQQKPRALWRRFWLK
jgi:tetratricopeptide (TPR) repeat protein